LGKKLLKVLVFPIVDPLVGRAADYLATRWERGRRPYRMRSFAPDDYRSSEAAEVGGEGWTRLAGGRALVFVHGTFSRAHSAFGAMPPSFVAELHRRYDGRVFAFDHFTMSDDPRRNAELFVEAIPDGTELDLDIVCHSRGGLVARVLAERAAELPLGARRLRVAGVVFVAVPNAGTILADAEHLGDLVDRYTNLLHFFPDNGVTDVLEAVITVVKQLAVGAVGGLEGLQAMRPGNPFLRDRLNRGSRGEVRYRAIASDYEPSDPGLLAWAKDGLMDRIFGRAQNDLVVPTLGVYDDNGSGCFPIQEPLVLVDAGIPHNGFFASGAARDQLLEWLPT
jgi:pimeloyl-ACP methyl ester carboxylesterase